MFTWSKGWCKTLVQLFTTDLKEKHSIEKCLECPALLKGKQSAMLIHVDDVLMCCDPQWLYNEFLPSLEGKYKVSFKVAKSVGDSVGFLKCKYILIEDGILVTPSTRHIKALVKKFQKYNDGHSARLAKTPCLPALFQKDESDLLDDANASAFRSLVGLALCISHDRWDVSFCVKSLASYLKQPTVLAWKALARLVGYVTSSQVCHCY